jgi:hypothetical protein
MLTRKTAPHYLRVMFELLRKAAAAAGALAPKAVPKTWSGLACADLTVSHALAWPRLYLSSFGLHKALEEHSHDTAGRSTIRCDAIIRNHPANSKH